MGRAPRVVQPVADTTQAPVVPGANRAGGGGAADMRDAGDSVQDKSHINICCHKLCSRFMVCSRICMLIYASSLFCFFRNRRT